MKTRNAMILGEKRNLFVEWANSSLSRNEGNLFETFVAEREGKQPRSHRTNRGRFNTAARGLRGSPVYNCNSIGYVT